MSLLRMTGQIGVVCIALTWSMGLAFGTEVGNCVAAYQQAATVAQSGDCTAAIPMFDAVTRQCPQLASAHHGLGLCYSLTGDHASAVRAMEEAIRLAPDRPNYAHDVALLYLHQKDWENALKYLAPLWEQRASLAFELTLALIGARHQPDARLEHDRDLVLTIGKPQPKNPEAMAAATRGAGLLKEGKADDAIAEFELMARLAPEEPLSFFYLAHAHQRAGDFLESFRSVERGIAQHPNDPMLVFMLGSMSYDLGRYEEADAAIGRLRSLDEVAYRASEGLVRHVHSKRQLKAAEAPVKRTFDTKERCEAAGGQWGQHGLFLEPICVVPTTDAGTACRDARECEGSCIAELTPEEQRLFTAGPERHVFEKIGQCSQQQPVFGCFPFVSDGKVDGILCVD